MIKLRLPGPARDLEGVRRLPGLSGLKLDPTFGVVPLDLRRDLYAVRADAADDLEGRRALSPEILGIYGDTRISAT